jgi:hypothetical protein
VRHLSLPLNSRGAGFARSDTLLSDFSSPFLLSLCTLPSCPCPPSPCLEEVSRRFAKKKPAGVDLTDALLIDSLCLLLLLVRWGRVALTEIV